VGFRSRFLGLRIRLPLEEDEVEIAVDIENLGTSVIGESFSTLEVEWSDGTSEKRQGRLPALPADTRQTLGPYLMTVHSAGVCKVFLYLGLTVPELTESDFFNATGRKSCMRCTGDGSESHPSAQRAAERSIRSSR
jgi:hypothetical protein